MRPKVAVIGSGFSGLSAASHLAHSGYEVHVFEKNSSLGGRARVFSEAGFTFDMGPSWYWMPDVFETFFTHFGKSTRDYYDLKELDPAYSIYFSHQDRMDIPSSIEDLYTLFESYEKGSTENLKKFLADAKYKYDVAMSELVFKPAHSVLEFASLKMLGHLFKLKLFTGFDKHVKGFFNNPALIQLMEFPVLFLGAKPANTPALYSMMNYSALAQGTWYPQGGMYKVIEGMVSLARELNVKFYTDAAVEYIRVKNKSAESVRVNGVDEDFDIVVAAADYHHVDQYLLDKEYRNYSPGYWDSRVMAPSCLIFYLGIDKKLQNLNHHTLFFDKDFKAHAKEIYDNPAWPEDPQFYVCTPSLTDNSVAPKGKENCFVLIPIAPGLEDTPEIREKYFNIVITRMESITNQNIREHVSYSRSYCVNDFKSDYHAFKGNAYGLANTLFQTAMLKPKMRNKHLTNLFYTGQLTVPGPGVPPSLISGTIVSREIEKRFPVSKSKIVTSKISNA